MAGVVISHVCSSAPFAQQFEVERAKTLGPGGVAVAVCKGLLGSGYFWWYLFSVSLENFDCTKRYD